MAYTEYFSTDVSAPTIAGTAGTLVDALDKILADGYGSKSPLGWAKEFTGTNKRVYRAATGTSRMYLRVDDTALTTDARCVGYETMSDVDTGTGPFPTNTQISGGLYIRKANTANATARPWYACGTEKWFYIHIYSQQTVYGTTSSTDGSMFFGECDSVLSGDIYNTLIIARSAAASSNENFGTVHPTSAVAAAHYIPRSYAGLIGAVNVGKAVRGAFSTAYQPVGSQLVPYPDPISGRIPLSRIDVFEPVTGGSARRLVMPPQFRAPLMNLTGNIFNTFSGVDGLAGKTYRIMPVYAATTQGCMAIEVA